MTYFKVLRELGRGFNFPTSSTIKGYSIKYKIIFKRNSYILHLLLKHFCKIFSFIKIRILDYY